MVWSLRPLSLRHMSQRHLSLKSPTMRRSKKIRDKIYQIKLVCTSRTINDYKINSCHTTQKYGLINMYNNNVIIEVGHVHMRKGNSHRSSIMSVHVRVCVKLCTKSI